MPGNGLKNGQRDVVMKDVLEMLPLLPGNGLKYGQRDEFIRCLTIHASCACQPSKKLTKR